MGKPIFLSVFLTAMVHVFAQATVSAPPSLPKEPNGILAAAAPFYDFNSADLKPWRLKATYQLYDIKGNPTEQGTYEYWWASPKIHRSTWKRPSATYTEWYSADGTHSYQMIGERLKFFEHALPFELFSPLPSGLALTADKTSLELQERPSKGAKFPCISLIPLKSGESANRIQSTYPTYCFDPQIPVLRTRYTFGEVTTEFNNIAKYQGRFLPRSILVFVGEQKILTASVDSASGLGPTDPALTPAPDAKIVKVEKLNDSTGTRLGHVLKKQPPMYPPMAKQLGQQGVVLIQVTIGIDGKVHDPEVVVAPSPILAAAALDAVSHWEYEPATVNGVPVELATEIRVVFSIGR